MGKDDCECFEFDIIFKDNEANELGPAYHDYKDGKIDIERVWRPTKKLEEPFLNSCCHEEPFDFTNYYRWPDHVVLMVVWHVLSFIVLYLWWKEKDRQPLRFRPFREIVVFWLVLDFIMIATCCQLAAAFTSSCKLMLFVWDCLLPPVLVFYIVKPLQFIFIHQWNQAKKNNASLETIKSFYSRRWVLTSRFVYLSMLVGAIPGFILFITNMSLDTYQGFDNMYNSFRCEWWQIPEEYQVAQNPTDPRCQCVYLSEAEAGTAAYAGYAKNCLLAASGFAPSQACTPAIDDEFAEFCDECSFANDPEHCGPCEGTFVDTGDCLTCAGDPDNFFACASCLQIVSQDPQCSQCFGVLSSKGCSSYLKHFYIHGGGACGFMSETPSTYACKFCLAANENTMAAWAAYCSFLMLVILIFLVGLARLQDQLWLREELMTALPFSVITIMIETMGLMNFDIHAQFKKTSPHYSLLYGFIFAWLWSLFCVSFLMPVIVCYYYRYLASKQEAEHQDETTRSTKVLSESVQDGPDKPRKRRQGLQKLHEQQVMFAITDLRCREIYTKFAAEEFTVENIKFLVAIHEFRHIHTTMTVEQAVAHAKELFHSYIKQGAAIEVNVPDDTKTQIGTLLGESTKRTRRRRQPQGQEAEPEPVEAAPAAATPTSTAEVVEWFSVAFDEIVELIVRDSWGRFTASSLFAEFLTLFNSERQLDKTLSRVDQGPSVKRTDSDRKVSKMSKDTSKNFEVHDEL